MVGDDPEADAAAAQAVGVRSLLVRTGRSGDLTSAVLDGSGPAVDSIGDPPAVLREDSAGA